MMMLAKLSARRRWRKIRRAKKTSGYYFDAHREHLSCYENYSSCSTCDSTHKKFPVKNFRLEFLKRKKKKQEHLDHLISYTYGEEIYSPSSLMEPLSPSLFSFSLFVSSSFFLLVRSYVMCLFCGAASYSIPCYFPRNSDARARAR